MYLIEEECERFGRLFRSREEMGGFSVAGEEAAGGKKESEASWENSHVQSQHRRSKRSSFQTRLNIVVLANIF